MLARLVQRYAAVFFKFFYTIILLLRVRYVVIATDSAESSESILSAKQQPLPTSPQSSAPPSALYAISPCDILTAVAAPAVAGRSSAEAQSSDDVIVPKVKRVSSLVTSVTQPTYVTVEDVDNMPPKSC
jgi:hypothetical protein